MFRNDKPAAALIQAAKNYLGYAAGPMLRNQFGERVGYNSQPWAGAFIDVVARECGLQLPSCVYTASGLAELINNGLMRSQPRPGDLVFFAFPSENAASAFAMPHVGIVIDTSEYKSTGKLLTIEGNSRPANAKYGQDTDGVHQRVRHQGDVLAYIRPKFNGGRSGLHPVQLLINVITKLSSKTARLEAAALEEAAREHKGVVTAALKPGLRNRSIEVVQLALGVTVNLKSATPGVWDSATANAFARYQRRIGYVGTAANGSVDRVTLQRLATETGLFQVTD
jgi:hypothetical protein